MENRIDPFAFQKMLNRLLKKLKSSRGVKSQGELKNWIILLQNLAVVQNHFHISGLLLSQLNNSINSILFLFRIMSFLDNELKYDFKLTSLC